MKQQKQELVETKKHKIASVKVNASRHGIVSRKEVKNTLLWYDTKTKKMQKFYGGQLKFSYEDGETKVAVEKQYITKKGITGNIWQIRQWFDENNDEMKLELVEENPAYLVFAFKYRDDDELESLESELYLHRFDYEVTEVDA